ncbi:MAG: hypothetical protein M1375_02190 [Candidatus Thermoplasmatota archaeon]|jgi:hypothetical protein|nr:hypothetical protein [Candidatus Thermoplasmatota archaeon]MCL5790766.1 hypothetical protein [Candidatus Thermoplasmatota archaeon]
MNPDYDIEVIRSSLLSGEIDDTVNFIKSRMKKYARIFNINRNNRFEKHLEILAEMIKVLEGKETTDEFRARLLSDYIYNEDDREAFVESLIYTFDYCIDRYNIKWPSFDGKRCDDL